ncbi:transcriptional regulator with XRE-family HTH domain [Chryseobacterium defluvii]|uniref:Transcriptional regulator with XRE-family HTH domain n=1 Tax=Chryseobacterium defluvii TaxID=160396 RepID=A0A840K8M5_9FLAO|nr:helix-turn-helix transcriptional regulator [Chryseobacterium defluvii]MBB4804755.1 transcriptional regulator with XRE-family HTH domain [Chryseobacterium defluvii]
MNSSIGFKIRKLREQKNISQEDLAYHLDISQSNLSKIENGAIEKIDFLFMQKVSDFFKVEPQYFLEGDTIINDIETSNNSAVGYISTLTINNNIDGDLFKNFVQNQEQITHLIEIQNKLIEKLFNK